MSKKKKTENKKSPYRPDDKVRVRKSYYTFAKEYPSKHLQIVSKKRKHKNKRTAKIAAAVAGFVLIVCLSYFAMSLGLDVSYKPMEKLTEESSSVQSDDGNVTSLADTGVVRALYMPYTELGNTEYVKNLIDEIKIKNANSVVIDFKTKEGKLAYTSLEDYAIIGKCALFDNNTVRRALDYFEEEKITVIARLFCFEDSTVSFAVNQSAVKYMGTDVNWLDGSDEEGGKPWLNPFSKKVQSYIKNIIKELLGFKIKGFILESLQFPDGELTASATYPGEKKNSDRNKHLKAFIGEISDLLPSDCFLLLSQSATDALDGNEGIYFGSMADSAVRGIVADTEERDEKYILDKKTDFASMISLFTSVQNNFPDKLFIPQIDIDEYSRAYFRQMRKSGYNSFILYSETGEY